MKGKVHLRKVETLALGELCSSSLKVKELYWEEINM